MGFYLNPDNEGFKKAVRSEIYVDKTELIQYTNKYLNTEQRYICVSRPRRFGKSMTLKMLAAYYSRGCNSKELLSGYKIEKNSSFLEHLNKYDVIYLNMQQFLIESAKENMTGHLEQEVMEELCEEYDAVFTKPIPRLAAALRKIYVKTKKQFIFLIGEWDCIMRERQEDEVKSLCEQYGMDFTEAGS